MSDDAKRHGRCIDVETSEDQAGKANPSILSTVNVEYYGSQTPLKNLANVTTPDRRLCLFNLSKRSSRTLKAIQRPTWDLILRMMVS